MDHQFSSLLLTTLLTFTISCSSAPENETQEQPKQLLVVVYDISKSVDQYAILTTEHLEMIYDALGANGGGRFYGLYIGTNSARQEPVRADVPARNLVEVKGNPYQQNHLEKKNETLMAQFEEGKQDFITSVSDIIQPKEDQWSIIDEALLLAKQILELPVFEGKEWNKNLLVISDMRHDEPPVHNSGDSMEPVVFNDDVRVVVVRPSSDVVLSEIFPKNESIVTTNIKDAIQIIQSTGKLEEIR